MTRGFGNIGKGNSNLTNWNKHDQSKHRVIKVQHAKKLLVFMLVVCFGLLTECNAFAAGLTHSTAANTFISYTRDLTNWSEKSFSGKHEDDGNGVILTGYVNGKQIKFTAKSYYYGLADISLEGSFKDLKTDWSKKNGLTDTGLVYLAFLWTIEDLGIIPVPVNGVHSTWLWGPYDIYDEINSGKIDLNYTKSDWSDVEISKGHMMAFHANRSTFVFEVDRDGNFSFGVVLP